MNCTLFKGGNGTHRGWSPTANGPSRSRVLPRPTSALGNDWPIVGWHDGAALLTTTIWRRRLVRRTSAADRRRRRFRDRGHRDRCAAVAWPVPALGPTVSLGLARRSAGSHFSGDIFLAFSTPGPRFGHAPRSAVWVSTSRRDLLHPWGRMDPFYAGVVQSVEEAVLNALLVNDDMVGRDGHRSPRLPLDRLSALLGQAT